MTESICYICEHNDKGHPPFLSHPSVPGAHTAPPRPGPGAHKQHGGPATTTRKTSVGHPQHSAAPRAHPQRSGHATHARHTSCHQSNLMACRTFHPLPPQHN